MAEDPFVLRIRIQSLLLYNGPNNILLSKNYFFSFNINFIKLSRKIRRIWFLKPKVIVMCKFQFYCSILKCVESILTDILTLAFVRKKAKKKTLVQPDNLKLLSILYRGRKSVDSRQHSVVINLVKVDISYRRLL